MTTSNTSPARTIAQILTDGKVEYLNYDFRARAVRRRGKPFDLAVAEKNLLTLKAILEQHGVTCWLVFGTCLGAVRDGGFIPHDTDTDLAVFAHEKDKVVAAIPDLVKAGLIPIRTKQPDDLLTFMREDEYIDIGFFGKFRDAEGFDYWCYQKNRVYGDHFDKFDQITFLNTTFLVPQRVEAYLASLYGAGWKTPVKNLPAKEPTNHREFRPFSNLLALADFFRDMPAHAVLKLSENFPSYHDYSDIDILCADRTAVLAHILAVGQDYQRRGFTIKQVEDNGHLHVDFYAPGAKRLNFRFDLLAALDAYKKLTISPDFAPAVLAGRLARTQHGATVQVPALAHDLALRFVEFVEWREERPDKVKHWEFIQKTGNFDFVEVVNRFTDLKINLAREAGAQKLTWTRHAPAEIAARQAPFLAAAETEFAAKRYAEAAEQYCAAFEVAPDTPAVLGGLGACLIELQDLASAYRCVARLAALEPANAVAVQARNQLTGICGEAEVAGGVAELLACTLAFCNDCI
ncbi:MAG: LicD family protein, partial [Pseudomonadota bacterium]